MLIVGVSFFEKPSLNEISMINALFVTYAFEAWCLELTRRHPKIPHYLNDIIVFHTARRSGKPTMHDYFAAI